MFENPLNKSIIYYRNLRFINYFCTKNAMTYIEDLEKSLESTRNKLINHNLYSNLNSKTKLIKFMETHVYAVWDFMSLIKALQRNLTCVDIPWTPNKNNLAGRLVNEIVLAEESDIDLEGNAKSHFELYKESMKEIGADTSQINNFISKIRESSDYRETINDFNIHADIKSFLNFTFDIIESGEAHKIASAFTFGRENVIPDMFIGLVKGLNEKNSDIANKFVYYLERHIELDGDDHGPIALKMIENLCGDDEKKWDEVTKIAKESIQMRIKLWDHICNEIKS